MRNKRTFLIIVTAILAVYYLLCAVYLNKLGYYNEEALFFIEKAKIVFGGVGNRLKVMGLTSPILPFYGILAFTSISYDLAPLLASSFGMAGLFYLISSSIVNKERNAYFFIVLLTFVFHPGILYAACAGKSIYMVLIFFYLFFYNILKFYRSNTTFHVSIASICLVTLIFCDYRFIWLSIFFIPLVLSITINSLNLSEQESIFRLFLSFNNPSLRRKLINKTFALYIIIFILPIVCILFYKLLNLTHAEDMNYFIESPYATWSIITDKLNYDLAATAVNYKLPDASLMVSAKILIFCPLILVAIFLFKENTYQILTLLTPFAFIEFIRIKYDKIFVTFEYYLLFLVLAFLCILIKAPSVRYTRTLTIIFGVLALSQLYSGYYYLKNSQVIDEKNFYSALFERKLNLKQADNQDIASYINSLPAGAEVLMDDAIAYPIAAFVNAQDFKKLVLPYQDNYLQTVEAPDKYADYILVATRQNIVFTYSQLSDKYPAILKSINSGISLVNVYETNDWVLYRIR
ncbi:hypothetical protein DJ568_16495 [Mucilaginibacter hurinus]|uniref:Glycosyltransferase RgtA/B/C/D-like domain-containing protein n=1 Tax=Mucilaginibacter hurinus TaxID=2201324 RepID=A0A367GJJ2_9SPHI|nr:hypothetical protein [Mucilaginibacter hurinus]RCH53634.1 hypothetical protein DJ568_16495 [Mucilaginibacter hurinus]